MDRTRAMELLKECLEEIPRLKELHHDNQECKLWIDKSLDIINEAIDEGAFNENDKMRFLRGQTLHLDWSWIDEASDKTEQNYYLTSLVTYETALKSIIQKYELLGEEAVHSEVVKLPKSSASPKVKTPKEKVKQLKQFLRELDKFRQLQIAAGDERLDPELDKLRTKLVRKSAQMKGLILPHGGQLIFTQFNEDFDAFDTAFTKPIYPWGLATQWHAAVDVIMQKTNETIGKLEMISTPDALREVVYPSGTPYDAYKQIKEIIALATKKLIIVDPYVDNSNVTLLENAQPGVEIQVLTRKMQGDFQLVAQKFKKQREMAGQGSVEVCKDRGAFHDRFIVADDNFFHMGASIKDAGAKVFAINEIEDSRNKRMLMESIYKAWDAAEKVL